MRKLALAVLVLLGLPSPRVALAWGDNGHIAVAKVADGLLTPAAHEAIAKLIPGSHIYDRNIAVFADSYKHTPEGQKTRAWHYVDIPLEAEGYRPERDCLNDNCVVAQLPAQRAILRDASRPLAERQLALKLVVHFVGDIHQPLHCAERGHDAGGNEVAVRLRDQHGIRNLHSVWDGDLVDENLGGADPEDWAAKLVTLITPAQRAEWEKVADPAAWANEGHALAVRYCYAGVPAGAPVPPHGKSHSADAVSLNDAYIEAGKKVVLEQIEKGGVRLARALNEDLK